MNNIMRKHLLLIFAIFLSACEMSNAQLNKSLEIKTINLPFILDTTITFKPDASFPEYRLALHFSTEDQIRFVMMRKKESFSFLDTIGIIDCDLDHHWFPDENVEIVKFMDVNMDGFDDLFVLDGIPEIAGYPSYKVWLFDPKSEGYFLNEEFSERISPECDFDEVKKVIKTNMLFYFRNPYEYSYYTYKVSSNHLVLIESIDQHFEEELAADDSERHLIWKHEKLIHNKMVVVERKRKSAEQALKENND